MENHFRRKDEKRGTCFHSFSIDRQFYSFIYYYKTGELTFSFKPTVFVLHRENFEKYFPDASNVDKGGLMLKLSQAFLNTELTIREIATDHDYTPLPIISQQVWAYESPNCSGQVCYIEERDLWIIFLDQRNIMSHVDTIRKDLWEYDEIHQGRYAAAVRECLYLEGVKIA